MTYSWGRVLLDYPTLCDLPGVLAGHPDEQPDVLGALQRLYVSVHRRVGVRLLGEDHLRVGQLTEIDVQRPVGKPSQQRFEPARDFDGPYQVEQIRRDRLAGPRECILALTVRQEPSFAKRRYVPADGRP